MYEISAIDCYSKYLLNSFPRLNKSDFSSILELILDETSLENPRSGIELNNYAVLALIEAEWEEDLSTRSMYLNLALEALQTGVDIYENSLCAAHLSLVSNLTRSIEGTIDPAYKTFVNTLQSAHEKSQPTSPGILYLPPNADRVYKDRDILKVLSSDNGEVQALFLLSEALCYSQLIFYSSQGLRLLNLAAQIFNESSLFNLKLGISSLNNGFQEGILYLHRAINLDPNSTIILQSLYLAYGDLGQLEKAEYWKKIACDRKKNISNPSEYIWSNLEIDSWHTYLQFESDLVLAVEPSFRSIVTSVLLAEADWFEKELEFWRFAIEPGMTAIDIGANMGIYTFSASKRVGSTGCVLAVEPFSGCVKCLQKTCEINQFSWVKICAGAASSHNGTARLALHSSNELNEIVSDSETRIEQPCETVSCFTLDFLIERENLTRVDFVKIDAEGHEMSVLAGSYQLIHDFHPTIIYENIASHRGSNITVANCLTALGYQLFRYKPYIRELISIKSEQELHGELNIIAIHRCKVTDFFKNKVFTLNL
jgi:FkbM family methyltransferase